MPRLFTIARPGLGILSTMAAPAGQPELPVIMNKLRLAGVDTLVSMLGPPEEKRIGLANEDRYARQAGLEFLRLPTQDFRAPTASATRLVAREIVDLLAAGKHVAIHCRGGVGRSSTLAAAVLVMEGSTTESAWAAISAARGLPVPETSDQRTVVEDLLR